MKDRHSSYRDDSSYGRGGLWSDLFTLSLGGILKSCLAVTVALYVLNQKHYLPKPLSAIVSKVLFYPTLPITAFRRLGEWSTVVDDTVILGGAPFGFVSFPEKLYYEYGVRACNILAHGSVVGIQTSQTNNCILFVLLYCRSVAWSICVPNMPGPKSSINNWE